jgi:hypothetical protein
MAFYGEGKFVVKEVESSRLKIITNEDKDSEFRFVTIFNLYNPVLSLRCDGSCRLFSTTTHTPKIGSYDGLIRIEDDYFKGDGRWVESPGVVSIHTKNTPTFSIPRYPNEHFIGIIRNPYGASGHGSFYLYLINTTTGVVGIKELQWGENKWDDDVEFKEQIK